ncbi:MAG: P-loop NTPase family protein [Eubacteriales bacterium]
MKNIIFIEGVSGVGKSTTTSKLCEALQYNGYTVSSHLEGDCDNPLELCRFAYLTLPEFEKLKNIHPEAVNMLNNNSIFEDSYVLVQYQTRESEFFTPDLCNYLKKREVCYKPSNPVPFAKFTEIFRNRWRRFRESDLAKQDYTVFDGAFLHHPINDMIRNYSASDDEIMKHLTVLIKTAAPLNPIIIYLTAEDIGECLIKANKSREQAIATKEQIEFWKNRKRIDLAVIGKIPVKSYVIDISNYNWESAFSRIQMIIADSKEV